VIAPSRGKMLAAEGPGERQVQVRDRPDSHLAVIEVSS
jgi:hypothetical protein